LFENGKVSKNIFPNQILLTENVDKVKIFHFYGKFIKKFKFHKYF